MIACKEALSGASYIAVTPGISIGPKVREHSEYARSRIVREARCAPQARPPVPNVPCIGNEGSLPIFADIALRKDAVSDAVITAAPYASESVTKVVGFLVGKLSTALPGQISGQGGSQGLENVIQAGDGRSPP
jgi:hypothetical protein